MRAPGTPEHTLRYRWPAAALMLAELLVHHKEGLQART